MELFSALIKERAETGRMYIMNVDHANTHSSFKDKVSMSNLCQEITLPTTPINAIDDSQGEIALCILSAINVGIVKEEELDHYPGGVDRRFYKAGEIYNILTMFLLRLLLIYIYDVE